MDVLGDTISLSTSSCPSSNGAAISSNRTVVSISGRQRLSAERHAVISTVSPIDRSLIKSTRRTLDQSKRGGRVGFAAAWLGGLVVTLQPPLHQLALPECRHVWGKRDYTWGTSVRCHQPLAPPLLCRRDRPVSRAISH